MNSSGKYIVCPNCGEENEAVNAYCKGCGVLINKNAKIESKDRPAEKKITDHSSVNRKQQQHSGNNILYLVLVLVVAGGIILYFAGIFDEPEPVFNQNFSGQTQPDPHGGVDLNNLTKINELQEIVANNPENHQALVDLAHLLNDSGFYEKAVTRYNEFLATHPEDADVWVDMGVCYYEMSEYDKARSSMLKAIDLKPNHQIAHFNLGIVAMASDSMEKAKEWWRKAVKIDPDSNIGKKAQDLLNTN